ncbi:energy transducer TonB family protein [Methylocystis suflitae]|uniref:energy transducer TonB family protein n=1 Tax=Methylocystis suflitae TaxID=2951405 RepID=UPI00210D8F31|nr:energy transducer TonB [Methylocystis suflitae]MCQ4188022.1 energy transducer TonB [Methylocystis suflitae]
MKLARLLTIAAALAACGAHAEDAKPAPTAPTPARPAAPTQSATPARAAAPKPATPATTQGAAAPAAAPVMSESKFLGALYTAIAKQTPSESPAGDGEVTASFHVNAQGKIDKVTIDKTTSPALSETVKKILSSVEAPPPPGGSMDVGQTFKFRGTPK